MPNTGMSQSGELRPGARRIALFSPTGGLLECVGVISVGERGIR
jgi:hypothetical protein